jgi:hypothetical protein
MPSSTGAQSQGKGMSSGEGKDMKIPDARSDEKLQVGD